MRSLTQDMTMADETASSRGLFIEQTYPTFPEEKKDYTPHTPCEKFYRRTTKLGSATRSGLVLLALLPHHGSIYS